ncbi:MAG: Kelch repeat-containing protein [Methanomassiliicoccales archaeon]
MGAALFTALLLITMVPSPSAAVEDNWIQLDDMPMLFYGFSTATLDDDRVFVSMGLVDVDIFDPESYTNRTWLFDPFTDHWTEMSPSPRAFVGARAVAMPDGNVYVFGGFRVDIMEVQGEVMIYDVASDSWSTGAATPDLTLLQAVALDDRRIMLMGGENSTSSDTTDECFFYDIVADEFSSADDLPNELMGGVAVNAHGTLYYIGGSDDSLIAQDEVYRYDVATDHWGFYARMPEGRYGDEAVLAGDGLVYMYGGKTGDTTNSQGRGTFKVLDLGDCSFVPVPEPPMQLSSPGMTATSEGRLVIFGGSDGDQMSTYVTSLRLFERDAWLGAEGCAPGESVRLYVSVDTMYAENHGFSGTALLMRNGTILSSYQVDSPTGGPASVLMPVPEDLSPGEYDVVIVDAGTEFEFSALSFEPMSLTLTNAPTPPDRIGELEDQIAELKDELAEKVDAWVGYVLLGLLLVVLVVLVLQMVRKR